MRGYTGHLQYIVKARCTKYIETEALSTQRRRRMCSTLSQIEYGGDCRTRAS
jgi:hypothetical protein